MLRCDTPERGRKGKKSSGGGGRKKKHAALHKGSHMLSTVGQTDLAFLSKRAHATSLWCAFSPSGPSDIVSQTAGSTSQTLGLLGPLQSADFEASTQSTGFDECHLR